MAVPATRWPRRARWARDALRLAGALVLGPVARRAVRPSAEEARRRLPGDELLPAATERWTHAITVRGGPQDVWPWLVQMGCRRAGWYSYDGLDNGGVPSARRILPELQRVEPRALFAWTPDAQDGFVVRAVDPGRALILGGEAGSLFRVTWAFVLEPLDGARTRVLVRAGAAHSRREVGLGLRYVARPLHFAMQRRQLLGLRRRVEGAARW